MSADVSDLSASIYRQIDIQVVMPWIASLPEESQASTKESIGPYMQNLATAIAQGVLDFVASPGGQWPAVFCTVPGLTAITDVAQLGISSTTVAGSND